MPDLLDVEIQAVDSNGDGIARDGPRLLAVPFTIPGERVRVRIDAIRGVATLVDILAASPHRVGARCPHFGPCGGCAWQHIAYAEQLRLKTALVERLIRVVVPDAPPVGATVPGADVDAPWGYRQKVHFVFAMGRPAAPANARADRLVMGHYARGARRVVPVSECPVHDERGNALAFTLHRRWARAGIEAAGPPGHERRERRQSGPPGVLRSIAIRVGRHTREIMTTLVITADTDKRLRGATKRAIETQPEAAFHLNLHPKQDAFIFGAETRRVTGAARLREEVAGTAYLISPTAFFQTNIRAAEALVQLVLAAIPAGATVLDLYAGAGLFALPLARAGHRVVAVEENRAAVADGEASRQLNRIPEDQCRFLTRPVEPAIRGLPRTDAVVLDPPRDGCSQVVLEGLCLTLRPRQIVYVSCNPEALARDLAMVTDSGYRLRSIQPVDMFPHTAHVETVAVLEKRRGREE